MNAPTKIQPFNALAAYEAERDENRRLWNILNNVLMVADDAVGQLARKGVNVTTKRAILAQARAERFEDVAA
ncbi:MAG TPA: hypothetical protein DIW45_07835 [Erythrobacter sp.]|nr:hypothetical protein [Erythrobacter sp.]